MESSGKDTFLIDGFPRNQDNLEGWNKEMNAISTVKMVLFFNCSEQVSRWC
jgi:UMP-CMP kinase